MGDTVQNDKGLKIKQKIGNMMDQVMLYAESHGKMLTVHGAC
jgi:hypothetical protein